MSKASTIYVIEPGRVGLLGHQYALNCMIGSHAGEAGFKVEYLVDHKSGKDLVQALNAQPVLDFNIYKPPPATMQEALDTIADGNREAEQNLHSALKDVRDGDMLVFHTVSYLGMLGAARWAKRYAPKNLKVRLLVRFPPDYTSHARKIPSDVVVELEKEFVKGLSAWAELEQEVSFFGDSREILDYLQSLMGWQVPLLPTSIAFNNYQPVPPSKAEKAPTFLLAGNGRKEKGILVLAEAIEHFVAGGGKGRFVVQSISNPKVAKAFEPLAEFVDIPNQHLEGADYFRFLSTADAILVPYDPQKYINRTSHVLIEGLGIGRPVITTAGTWMQAEAQRISPGSALFMAEYSAKALHACLKQFCEQREALSQSAWSQAEHVREIHGEDRFLKAFLGF